MRIALDVRGSLVCVAYFLPLFADWKIQDGISVDDHSEIDVSEIGDSYRNYKLQLSNLELQSTVQSKLLDSNRDSVSSVERWKVDVGKKAAWKITKSDQRDETYSETLLRQNQLFNVTSDSQTNKALVMTSWVHLAETSWEKNMGVGDTGFVFGYLWDGINYYSIEELLEDGKVTTFGSRVVVRSKNQDQAIVIEFEKDIGWCPVRVYYAEYLVDIDGTRNKKELTVEVDSFQEIQGISMPKNYTVTIKVPARRKKLPKGVVSVDGVIRLNDKDDANAKGFVEFAETHIESRATITKVRLGMVRAEELAFKSSVAVDMPVSMQDARYLYYRWDGQNVVPKVDEEFRKLADKATFGNDVSSEEPPNNYTTIIVIALTCLLLGVAILYRIKSTGRLK